MNRFITILKLTAERLYNAMSRFPLTLVCLIGAAALICHMISLSEQPGPLVEKLAYTFLLGSFLGVLAQFCCERFEQLYTKRTLVYAIATLLIIAYFLVLMPAQSISYEVSTRTFVAVVAMFCAFIWVPSYKGGADFDQIALVHFKSAFIAVLYAAVLSAGCASILASIDILLFKIDNDIYAYTMTIIWVLFATLYYLSLLPLFNARDDETREYAQAAAAYPRFLEILVSYIAIPLLAAFTLVLTAYFIKILVTVNWPSGQLGGMILAYATAGLTVFILASLPENRFAAAYRRVFPKVLIPIVIMQLVSVGIRLDAYGITESRYYIAMFGIFALICGITLSCKTFHRNGIIALLAATFAIISVIPPVDAFSVSRACQITRLENMLEAENILSEGQITPQAEASLNLRLESTSILNYLQRRDYTEYVSWLPADFSTHRDMKSLLGFEPAYARGDIENKHYFANLDAEQPIDVSGYEIMTNMDLPRKMKAKTGEIEHDSVVLNSDYKLVSKRLSEWEVHVAVQDSSGTEVIGTGLYDFTDRIAGEGIETKQLRTPEQMTLDVENSDYRLRVIFQNIYVTKGDGPDAGADYGLIVLFGKQR